MSRGQTSALTAKKMRENQRTMVKWAVATSVNLCPKYTATIQLWVDAISWDRQTRWVQGGEPKR